MTLKEYLGGLVIGLVGFALAMTGANELTGTAQTISVLAGVILLATAFYFVKKKHY